MFKSKTLAEARGKIRNFFKSSTGTGRSPAGHIFKVCSLTTLAGTALVTVTFGNAMAHVGTAFSAIIPRMYDGKYAPLAEGAIKIFPATWYKTNAANAVFALSDTLSDAGKHVK